MPDKTVQCMVFRDNTGFTFTASVDETSLCRATFTADPESCSRTLAEQVLPALQVLKHEGYTLGIQLGEETESVWFRIGAILGDVLDGTLFVVPVLSASQQQSLPAPLALPPAPPANSDPNAASKKKLLRELTKLTSWNRLESAEQYANEYRQLVGDSPETEAAIEQAKQRGRAQRELEQKFSTLLARKDDAAARALEPAFLELMGEGLGRERLKKLRQDHEDRVRSRAPIDRSTGAPPPIPVAPVRSHVIQKLEPSSRWELVVDETGFREDARRDAVVGVLVPESVKLPPGPDGFHATTATPSARNAVLQQVLNEPVGVLGLNVRPLRGLGDTWLAGVLELVEWTARLLPIQGPTSVLVSVERHGEYKERKDLQSSLSQLSLLLRRRDPARYGQLQLSLRVQDKTANPLNAYADVVAHTWGSQSEDSRARLTASRLEWGCLHDGDSLLLREAWDRVMSGEGPTGPQWRTLVHTQGAATPDTLVHEVLSRLSTVCGRQRALWHRYLSEVIAHQQGKAVDLRALGREVKWLAECRRDEPLPPALELAWTVTQLESANHEGHVKANLEERLEALSVQLVDEEPTLVCQADLNRAVLCTNAFRFDEAERRLERWKDARPREPGLRHFGRLLSQRGQLEAFRGRNAEAAALFQKALDVFARLSDPSDRANESRHTGTYLAVATMDLPGAPLSLIRERVAKVVSLELDEMVRLAADASPGEKFAHHLLLRFLVSHGSEVERTAYLSARAGWQEDFGHPWPLIMVYRAALLWPTDPAAAGKLMDRAAAQCLTQGTTVKAIGAVITEEAAAWRAGARSLDRMKTKLPFNFR